MDAAQFSPGVWKDDVYHFPLRVYYEDTDAVGIVYHSNYLNYAERARTEMLRTMGFNQSTMLENTGVAFVMRKCTLDFMASARLDDMLTIKSWASKFTKTSVVIEQEIMKDDVLLCRVEPMLVCINAEGRATRIPDAIRAAVEIASETRQLP